ncbi:MAG: cell division protein SepF [Clostridia bacterium]|nr:cell division protein SepF [Clostridia bacterium]MDO4749677.1 cell division protein SepF [Eubacteriales bacterium]
MSLLDELKKLTKPYDDDEDFVEEEVSTSKPAPKQETSSPAIGYSYAESARRSASPIEFRRDNKVVNINAKTQLAVVLVKPERFESAAEIADHLREKHTVVMNLEQTNKDIARRLIDFLSGVAYAQDGKIKRVAASTYLITPFNVDLMGDLLDELESSGVYF